VVEMTSDSRDYRDWLISLVNDRRADYTHLLRELYTIEFYSLIDYDEDRGKDGMMLREEWYDGTESVRGKVSLDFGVANVLEVLIGIAKRMEFQLFGTQYYDDCGYINIFWDLIGNLGLEGIYGDVSRDIFDEIRSKVTHFLDRDYFCHKSCNIFVFENTPKNLKKLNIWTQMAIYFREKWPI
jgi:hypothetical protein